MSSKQKKEIVDLFLKSVECMKLIQTKEWMFGNVKIYSSQMHTICAIHGSGEINLTDLAGKMGITKAGASKFVVKLQEYGFVEKYQSAENKKEVYFALTEKGEEAYNAHEEFSNKTFGDIYDMMDGLSPKEVDMAQSFMKKLAMILENASK